MRKFDSLYKTAAKRKGGPKALEALLVKPLTKKKLQAISDDRWLSAMARQIFQAGFSRKVIADKWPGFEKAFDKFSPRQVALYGDKEIDRLLANKNIVRNGQKITAVIKNATFINELSREYGGAGTFFAQWPSHDLDTLLELMKKDGNRLGGNTGQRFLRMMGRDCYVLTPDVVKRLIAENIIKKLPSSKRDMTAVQSAFNQWHEQSNRSYAETSQILAMSVG